MQLAKVSLFSKLPNDVLERLERSATPLEPSSGMEIFSQGAPADAVYAVVSGEGHIRIGFMDNRAKKLMVEVFRRGDVFGEIGVLDGGVRSASACVDGRVKLLRINAATFIAILNENPQLGADLARTLSRRLRRTFELFRDATFETLEVRLARQLLYLADLQGRATAQGIVLACRLKQPDLADLLGTTTRSIITILNEWRDTGLVHYDGASARLTLRDEKRMQELVTAAG